MKYLVFVDTWTEKYGTAVYCLGVFDTPEEAQNAMSSVPDGMRTWQMELEENRLYALKNPEDSWGIHENEWLVARYVE